MILTVGEWTAIQVDRGVLQPLGTHNGVDIYLAVKHPWMEPDMNPNDPTRSCACNPVIPANPQCDGGDDDEED